MPWRPDDDADRRYSGCWLTHFSPESKSHPCGYVRQATLSPSRFLRPLSPQKLGPTRVLDRRQILWTVHGRNEFPVRSIENPVMLEVRGSGSSTTEPSTSHHVCSVLLHADMCHRYVSGAIVATAANGPEYDGIRSLGVFVDTNTRLHLALLDICDI